MQRFKDLRDLNPIIVRHTRMYAVCFKHPFDILSAVLFLREQDCTVLLMNGDTPLETARATAERSGANGLFFGEWKTFIPLHDGVSDYEPGLLQYSSGTTGKPKLIWRSWASIDREIKSYNERLGSSGEDRPVILVPISHTFGLIAGTLTARARGMVPIIVWDKNPKFALHAIQSTSRSMVYGVPYLFHVLDQLGKGTLQYHKLVSSGAPLPEGLFNRLSQSCQELWHQYGSSETGCISLGANPASPFDVGAPLKHLDVTFAPLTEDGTTTDPLSGYEEIVIASGEDRIHTRDVGYRLPSGSLCVMGRMDDLINVSGLKVAPAEVENIIGGMPGVIEAAVYKGKHHVWGEAVKALVIAERGIRPEDVRNWCIRYLPAYKVPGMIQIVDYIPKMPSGKLSRKLLREKESN